MDRATETVRATLKAYDRDHPDRAIFAPIAPPLDDSAQGRDLQAVPPRSLGRGAGHAVRPDPVERLPRPERDAGRARSSKSSSRRCRTRASTTRRPQAEILGPMPGPLDGKAPRKDQGPQGPAPLPGQPLRGAAAGPRAGDAPVPQDELPEAPGRQAPRRPSTPPRPGPPTSTRSRAAGGGPGRQEPDHPRQPPAGGLDRQAPRRPDEQLLRAGLRRQHVPDPGRREVRLLPRQQVQHLCLVGDHEELRPHDPRGELPPRPLRHRPRGDVRGRRRQPRPTSTSTSPP